MTTVYLLKAARLSCHDKHQSHLLIKFCSPTPQVTFSASRLCIMTLLLSLLLPPRWLAPRVSRPSVPGHMPMPMVILFLAIALVAAGARADCYWPDGSENDQHQPCYSPHGGAVGLCCGAGDVCLSNGVCMSNSAVLDARARNIYYRGSCTFRDWSEGSNCPTICLKGPGISPHTNVGVIPCPDSDTKWYCADGNMNKANCSSGAFIVSLPSKSFPHTSQSLCPS